MFNLYALHYSVFSCSKEKKWIIKTWEYRKMKSHCYILNSIKLFFSFHMYICIHILSNDHSFNPVSDQRSASEFPPLFIEAELPAGRTHLVTGGRRGNGACFLVRMHPCPYEVTSLCSPGICQLLLPDGTWGPVWADRKLGHPLHATLRFETTDAIFTFLHLAGFYWHLSISLPVLVTNPNVTHQILVFSLEVTFSL